MTKTPKVFCIGFMKTGTTTLNRALSILGYRVSHDSWKWLPLIMQEDWESIQPLANKWDALEDNPIPLIYRELDHLFPDSKFILSTRDTEKWYTSVSYHIGTLRSPMHEWLFGRGKSIPSQDRSHTLRVYEQHKDQVLEYFKDRPNDLLVMDVTKTDSWSELCHFLGQEIPETAFPHANKSTFSKPKNDNFNAKIKLVKKRLFNPAKIWWYNQKGCIPSAEQRLKKL